MITHAENSISLYIPIDDKELQFQRAVEPDSPIILAYVKCSFLPQIFCSHLWDHLQSKHITEMVLIFRGTKDLVEKKETSFVVVIILASDSELTLLCITQSLNAINVIIFMQNQNRQYNTII